MKDSFVEVVTADGTMDAFVTHPEEGGPFPALILYMDIWGVREELYDIARSLTTVGYCCAVPDLYYRHGRRVHFDFRNEKNQAISRDRLEGEKLRAILARPQVTNKMVMADTGAILEFFKRSAFVRDGGVGAFGYCMGGRYAMCAAGTYPETIIASASLHGTALISEQEDSPHRLASRLSGEFYCGFAEHDAHAPPQLVRQMEKILKPCPVRYRYVVHAGAQHGYALPERDVHDKHATARDWENILAMFHRQMPPCAV